MTLELHVLGMGGFPDPGTALREPNGLLAAGGDLSPARLLDAYANGIFPWYSEGQPILWWSPDPRMVFRNDGVHLSRRFRRTLRALPWIVRSDTDFAAVIAACAAPRPGQDGTWIIPGMQAAYRNLHHLGHAHSIEVFDGPELVGGLYGVAVGRMFFAESMFSTRPGGSKVALAALAAHLQARGWPLFDAQIENRHLLSMGGEAWPRSRFLGEVRRLAALAEPVGPWTRTFGARPAAALAG